MLNQRSDKLELLRIAESVANEKSIDKEIIISSMESAIQKAAKTRFGTENDIRAIIDRKSGDINLHKVRITLLLIQLKKEILKENGINIGNKAYKEKKYNVITQGPM